MDEKEQEKVKAEEKKPAEVEKTIPGTDDTQNRPATEPPAEEQPDMIARANFAAERSEKAAAELKKQNDRAEKIAADQIASGRGQMVPAQAPITDEQKASNKRIKAIADATGSSWGKKYE